MAVSVATKAGLQTLSTTIQDALQEEMVGIQTEVAPQAGHIEAPEHSTEAQSTRIAATDTAVSRQGEMILAMRRHLEDLDNRGRKCNIRIQGITEAEGGENVEEVLSGLFRLLLQNEAPQHFEFKRAPEPYDHAHWRRDPICCLHSFPVKDAIMQKARECPTWSYHGAQVSLYNDLSPIMMQARWALRPVTSALRDRNITYKWGFPFALLARHQNGWASARWPEEMPRFLEELGLPPILVTNWVLGSLEPKPRPQRAPLRPDGAWILRTRRSK
ncbi:Hypothetical predicted protein [Pelobates cultripes]|uniref:Uncharacterized protein n=1 Tax=Pelobates cultripes TaxID=61616 RepID=A0AAD1T7G2_PELCU|nr:Hypothetical predicted protein [Pelobates cultripes]